MNPLLTIWTRPSDTIEYVLEHKTRSYGFLLIVLTSISVGFTAFSDTGLMNDQPLIAIILASIVSAILSGLLGWVINSALYTWVGKMLGGSGKFKDMMAVVPLSSIPLIWMMPYNILLVVMFGKDLFRDASEFAVMPAPLVVFNLLTALLMFGFTIFGVVISSKAIGAVHGFSAMRGFGTIAIIIGLLLILFIPIIILLLMFAFVVPF